ncbi:MAG: multiheme c-type cytochrome ExtKL [Thermodesulfovibrionales bacterium]|nr:multiheme c-type cytochrome ExtKL [Thermodesulfovibrionales bacterium]
MKWILVLLLALVPTFAFASQKANSIDELAKMYDVSSCKACHPKQYEEWQKSYHAISLVGSPRTMATLASAVKDGILKEWTKSGAKEVKDIKVEHMLSCLKCHLPQIKDATDAVAKEIAQAAIDGAEGDTAAQEKLKKVGINCIVCHNQKALIHKWTDGETEQNVIYGNKEGSHADAKFKTMKKSPIMKESILCGQCHGLGPNFELKEPTQCATLYGSYLHAYIPSGGSKTCQECHMDKGHFMPGYRDPDQAKKAVSVKVDAKGMYFLPKAGDSVPTATVTITLKNKAGHRIPDG